MRVLDAALESANEGDIDYSVRRAATRAGHCAANSQPLSLSALLHASRRSSSDVPSWCQVVAKRSGVPGMTAATAAAFHKAAVPELLDDVSRSVWHDLVSSNEASSGTEDGKRGDRSAARDSRGSGKPATQPRSSAKRRRAEDTDSGESSDDSRASSGVAKSEGKGAGAGAGADSSSISLSPTKTGRTAQLRGMRLAVSANHSDRSRRAEAAAGAAGGEIADEFFPSWQQAQVALCNQLSEGYMPPLPEDSATAEGIPDFGLPGLQSQCAAIFTLAQRVLLRGESQSALLVGHRGCGKSLALRRVLQLIEKRHSAATGAGAKPPFVVAHLDGAIIKTDPTAVYELSRQLALGGEPPYVGDEDGAGVTGAAALSGAGAGAPTAGAVGSTRRTTFEHQLNFVVDALREGRAADVPIFIVLDEFDTFASRGRQTLLYNLFDITQSSHVQVAVIGLTRKLNIVDSLEKRLRSRFSHRQILFVPPTLEVLNEVALRGLSLSAEFEDLEFAEEWNTSVTQLLATKKVKQMLRRFRLIGWSFRALRRWLALAVSSLSSRQPLPTAGALQRARDHLTIDSAWEALKSLSILEMVLVIAMIQIERADSSVKYNFEMVFKEYQDFVAGGGSSVQGFGRDVALKAYDHLFELGVVRWEADSARTGRGSHSLSRAHQPCLLTVDPHDAAEAIKAGEIKVPSELKAWVRAG